MKLLAVLLLTALVGATQLRPDASQATPASSASPASPASSTARTLALHYVNLGIKEFDNHNWDAAEADFTKAINADPTLTDAYTWRGDTRDNKGDPAGALLDYAQAIKHDPKDQYAYATKCDTEREVAHYDAGIRDCKKAIALDPHDAYAYRMLGRLYVARGGNADYVNAVSSFTQSIKADNTVPITYAYRCQARELLENYSQALEDCDRALALDSSNHTAVFYEGVVLRDLGRFQDAVAEWNLYTKLPYQP
jgi:tetratricopeptide (TPR) repeat protein